MAKCRSCEAGIVFVRMADSGKAMPCNPGPDPAGTVAARKVATRYVDGYVITAIRPLEDGFMPMRTHFSVCEKARKTNKTAAAKPASKPTDGAPALF